VEWPESKPAGWQTGLVAEERGGLTRAGGSTVVQTERLGRWWWSRGATEGAGKEVEGAPGVGTELAAVSGSSEGDRGGVSWQPDDGGRMAQWRQQAEEEEKGLLTWGGVLLL
jgi:hypothetical protein